MLLDSVVIEFQVIQVASAEVVYPMLLNLCLRLSILQVRRCIQQLKSGNCKLNLITLLFRAKTNFKFGAYIRLGIWKARELQHLRLSDLLVNLPPVFNLVRLWNR